MWYFIYYFLDPYSSGGKEKGQEKAQEEEKYSVSVLVFKEMRNKIKL